MSCWWRAKFRRQFTRETLPNFPNRNIKQEGKQEKKTQQRNNSNAPNHNCSIRFSTQWEPDLIDLMEIDWRRLPTGASGAFQPAPARIRGGSTRLSQPSWRPTNWIGSGRGNFNFTMNHLHIRFDSIHFSLFNSVGGFFFFFTFEYLEIKICYWFVFFISFFVVIFLFDFIQLETDSQEDGPERRPRPSLTLMTSRALSLTKTLPVGRERVEYWKKKNKTRTTIKWKQKKKEKKMKMTTSQVQRKGKLNKQHQQ